MPLILILKNKKSISHFWLIQISFWLFLCFVSFFTLTFWYQQKDWIYFAYNVLQATIGLLISIPLYWVFMRIWEKPPLLRLVISIFCVLLTAFVWTVIRIFVFVEMTAEVHAFDDFGGWYFSDIFTFLCWACFFHGIRYYQLLQTEHRIMLKAEAEAREEQLKRMTAQTVARDAKIKMLRYQLNPHFLCNTLNAINSLIEVEASERAQLMTVQLSKFLRYSLDNNPDTKLALENEINALNLYLEIEKTRFGERLQLDFQVSEKAKSARVPSLLIQPIIENSMKHVIAQNEDGGTISLRAEVVDERLILELSDTGSGIKATRCKINHSKGRGVGLSNIDERLKVLYENNYLFELVIMPSGGLKTIINIPYECLRTM